MRFIIVFLFICCSIIGYSQKYINLKTYNVDSLLLILPDKVGEERVNTLNNLAVSLFFVDSDESTHYAEEAMSLAKELDYQEGIAAAYRNFGYINFYQGNYQDALNNAFELIRIYEKLEKKNTVAMIYHEIAWLHYMASNYEKAIEYEYIALEIFREHTDDGITVVNARDTINIYKGLIEMYYYLGKEDKSLELHLVVLDLAKRNNFSNIELMIKTWAVGHGFSSIGESDSAKTYFFKALAYPDDGLSMRTLKYRSVNSLGWIYYDEGDIDSALYYIKTAFEFYNEHGFLYWALVTSRNLGYIYYNDNQLTDAEKYFLESERIFNEMLAKNSWYSHDSLKHIANYGLELYFPVPPVRLKEMMWNDGRIMYKLLYQLHSAKNRIDEALKYHIAYSDAKDTVNKLQRNRETIELQTRYESERKDQQIETLSLANELKESRLQQNRYFLFGSVGLFILILMFGYILFRQNKLKSDQQMLVLQQRLFRSQMNPHFIFNSLASIQNFIVKQDSRRANIFLSRFSELVRSILDNSTQEYIALEKEISTRSVR